MTNFFAKIIIILLQKIWGLNQMDGAKNIQKMISHVFATVGPAWHRITSIRHTSKFIGSSYFAACSVEW